MKCLLTLLFITMTGCITTMPTDGGRASASGIRIIAPDNPASISSIDRTISRTVNTAPTGEVVETTTNREAVTLGTSQDVAAIIASLGGAQRLTIYILAAALIFGGYRAWKKQWPLLGSTLAGGGVFALASMSLTPIYLATVAGIVIYIAYEMGKIK